MATTKIGTEPADVFLPITCGDDIITRINMAVDVSGRTYTAGVNNENGELITAITCTVTTEATGIIDLSLTDTQTTALQTNGKTQPNLSWYFAETISGLTTTLLQGKCQLRFR